TAVSSFNVLAGVIAVVASRSYNTSPVDRSATATPVRPPSSPDVNGPSRAAATSSASGTVRAVEAVSTVGGGVEVAVGIGVTVGAGGGSANGLPVTGYTASAATAAAVARLTTEMRATTVRLTVRHRTRGPAARVRPARASMTCQDGNRGRRGRETLRPSRDRAARYGRGGDQWSSMSPSKYRQVAGTSTSSTTRPAGSSWTGACSPRRG